MERAGREVKGGERKRQRCGEDEVIERKKAAVHEMPEGINKLLTGTATQQYKLSPLKTLCCPNMLKIQHSAAAAAQTQTDRASCSVVSCYTNRFRHNKSYVCVAAKSSTEKPAYGGQNSSGIGCLLGELLVIFFAVRLQMQTV